MRFRATVLISAFLSLSACSSSGGVDTSPDGSPESPPEPEREPEPLPDSPSPRPPTLETDEAVRAAYEKATGAKLDDEWGCIGRTGVEGVVLVGSFAHDRGCATVGGFVAGRWLEARALDERALQLLGWADKSSEERGALAMLWTERVLFHWDGNFVSTPEKAFELAGSPKHTPPKVSTQGDVVVVEAWVQQPPGMQDRSDFDLTVVRFAPDGSVSRSVEQSFGVEGSRLR